MQSRAGAPPFAFPPDAPRWPRALWRGGSITRCCKRVTNGGSGPPHEREEMTKPTTMLDREPLYRHHDPRRAPVKDKSNYSAHMALSGSTNGDIKRRTYYMVSHARYLKKHDHNDAVPTIVLRGGPDKGFRQNNVTLPLLASSINGRAMEFTGRFGTAMRVTFGAASRVKHSFTGNMMPLGQTVHPRGAQKGEASPLHHQTSGKGDPLVHARKAHISKIHQEDRCLPSQVRSRAQFPLTSLNRLGPSRGMRVFHEENTGHDPPIHGLRIAGPLLTRSNIVFKRLSQKNSPILLSGGVA